MMGCTKHKKKVKQSVCRFSCVFSFNDGLLKAQDKNQSEVLVVSAASSASMMGCKTGTRQKAS